MVEPARRRGSWRFLVLVVGALVALVAVLGHVARDGGSSSGRRGAGTSTVVLSPVPGQAAARLPRMLQDAAAVLRSRVTALDPAATVVVRDGSLVVTTRDAKQVAELGSPGQLEVRPVLTSGSSACPAPTAAGLDDLARPLTACTQDGRTSYRLGPARLTGSSVRGASSDSASDDATVVIELTPLGRRQFRQLTREVSSQPAPRNQLAIVVDGVVISAPEVSGPVDGDAQISGVSAEQSRALAVTLRYGALPLAFAISGGG